MTENRSDRRIIIVVGPTATGKTSLALRLAKQLDGEVVGSDAYQIYRGMDIGTAKPTAMELGELPHHMLDIVDPDEHFDAHEYLKLADDVLAGIFKRGKKAIVAGGTGLYIRALVRGLADMPGADQSLRAELAERASREGTEALHQELAAIDPVYANRLGPRDLLRISRGLEVYTLSGRTITEVHEEHQRQPDRLEALWLGLDPGQEKVRARIGERTEVMFETGFVEEVRDLLDAGYGPELPPMRALGYRAVCQLLAGEIDEEEARELTTRHTARYARRQRNWFRSEKVVRWLKGPEAQVDKLVNDFLTNKNSKAPWLKGES